MDIKATLLPLLGERIINNNTFNKTSVMMWACDLIAQGYQSKHLTKLSQLDRQRHSTVEKYFNCTLEELSLDMPCEEEAVFILAYAKDVAQAVIIDELLPQDALGKFLDIIEYTKNDPRYMDFSKIIMEIHLLNSKKQGLGSGMTLHNAAQYIKEECRLFLAMESLDIPIAERMKSYCNQCEDFVRYTYETTPDNTIMYICPRCHCPDILLPFQQVKRKLIKKYSPVLI